MSAAAAAPAVASLFSVAEKTTYASNNTNVAMSQIVGSCESLSLVLLPCFNVLGQPTRRA